MGTAKQDSVILHLEDFEDIDCMKDAEAGKLLKAILCYVSTGALPDKLGVQARTMFGYIRRHIDRDKDKYAEKCRKRAEAGRKGGRPKKEANDSDENQNKAKKANGFFEKQNNPDPEPDPESEEPQAPRERTIAVAIRTDKIFFFIIFLLFFFLNRSYQRFNALQS